ncbi:Synaptonemal complex protein 2 [Merluccius polli]|uniref:Synaptonemal complex protein 2 n=1 Tax=Merluccius polli TaxID=89951 RepID=A0AA47M8I1_MERPO|nr:Synaptonemal complex protein 2 [Merluccius polli]
MQNRSRRMEHYSKQSAKTAQHHVTSLSAQVNKYRAQCLENVHLVLHEEITNLEEEGSTLNNMQKELTVYWRKQSTAFHSYLEKENTRHKRLKNALQNNNTYSLEYEDKIFTSQMCLMMKDMKCVQDRLFKEMCGGWGSEVALKFTMLQAGYSRNPAPCSRPPPPPNSLQQTLSQPSPPSPPKYPVHTIRPSVPPAAAGGDRGRWKKNVEKTTLTTSLKRIRIFLSRSSSTVGRWFSWRNKNGDK